MTKPNITTEEAARRVLRFYNKHVNSLFHIDTVAAETGLTVEQVRRGERYAKTLLAGYPGEVPNVRLHISLSNVSEHGLVRLKNDDYLLADGVARTRYLSGRAKSELEYSVQAINRTKDADVAKLLGRALTQQRAANESLQAAAEKIEAELAKLDSK